MFRSNELRRCPLHSLLFLLLAGQFLVGAAMAQSIPPLVEVQKKGKVRVHIPFFVRVETGPDGTYVRAPFTRYDSRRYRYPPLAGPSGVARPYSSPPRCV